MDTEDKDYIKILSESAINAHDANEAMKYAQAALNLAQASQVKNLIESLVKE